MASVSNNLNFNALFGSNAMAASVPVSGVPLPTASVGGLSGGTVSTGSGTGLGGMLPPGSDGFSAYLGGLIPNPVPIIDYTPPQANLRSDDFLNPNTILRNISNISTGIMPTPADRLIDQLVGPDPYSNQWKADEILRTTQGLTNRILDPNFGKNLNLTLPQVSVNSLFPSIPDFGRNPEALAILQAGIQAPIGTDSNTNSTLPNPFGIRNFPYILNPTAGQILSFTNNYSNQLLGTSLSPVANTPATFNSNLNNFPVALVTNPVAGNGNGFNGLPNTTTAASGNQMQMMQLAMSMGINPSNANALNPLSLMLGQPLGPQASASQTLAAQVPASQSLAPLNGFVSGQGLQPFASGLNQPGGPQYYSQLGATYPLTSQPATTGTAAPQTTPVVLTLEQQLAYLKLLYTQNGVALPANVPLNVTGGVAGLLNLFATATGNAKTQLQTALTNTTTVDTAILNASGISATGGKFGKGVASNPFAKTDFLTDSQPFNRFNSGLWVTGGNGNGRVKGTVTQDVIEGRASASNIIDGQGGSDILVGGSQADLVQLRQGDKAQTLAGDDVVFMDLRAASNPNPLPVATSVDTGGGNDTLVITVDGDLTNPATYPPVKKGPGDWLQMTVGNRPFFFRATEKVLLTDADGNVGKVIIPAELRDALV